MKQTSTVIYSDFIFKPEEWLRFIQFDHFLRHWRSLELEDEDLRALELSIMASPTAAPIVPGTGGLRKLRFAPARWNTGKRGALRVCYIYFSTYAVVALATVYSKSRKDNLTAAEKATIRKVIGEVELCLAQEKTKAPRRRS